MNYSQPNHLVEAGFKIYRFDLTMPLAGVALLIMFLITVLLNFRSPDMTPDELLSLTRAIA